MKIWSENYSGMIIWFCKKGFICGCGLSIDSAHEAFVIAAKKSIIKADQ